MSLGKSFRFNQPGRTDRLTRAPTTPFLCPPSAWLDVASSGLCSLLPPAWSKCALQRRRRRRHSTVGEWEPTAKFSNLNSKCLSLCVVFFCRPDNADEEGRAVSSVDSTLTSAPVKCAELGFPGDLVCGVEACFRRQLSPHTQQMYKTEWQIKMYDEQ